MYFKEFFSLFKSIKSQIAILLIIFFEYILFNSISNLHFKRINLFIYLLPVFIIFFFTFYNSFKKNKSINLEYSAFYAVFPFFIINGILQFYNLNGYFKNVSPNQNIVLSILTILNLLFSYGGFKMYRSTINNYRKLYQKINLN